MRWNYTWLILDAGTETRIHWICEVLQDKVSVRFPVQLKEYPCKHASNIQSCADTGRLHSQYRPHSVPSIPSCDNLLTGHPHAICVGFGHVMPVLLQNRLPERQTPLRVTAGHHSNRVRQNHHAERVSFCQLDSLRYSRNYGYWALRQRRNVPRAIALIAAGKLREIRNIHVLWEYPSQ